MTSDKVKKITPHRRKLNILSRLLDIPEKQKRFFYAREMKFLKILEERYSLDFLEIITFPKKYDSLAILVSKELKQTMNKKWNNFNFKIDTSKYQKYNIGKKSGEDFIPTKKQLKRTKDLFK